MEDKEQETLLRNFHSTNRTLQARAIAIGFFVILTIGLVLTEDKRMDTVLNCLNAEHQLEKLRLLDSITLKTTIETRPFYFEDTLLRVLSDANINTSEFFYEIKQNNYQDKEVITTQIKEMERIIDEANAEKTIGLAGINIPIKSIYLVSFLILMLLFQDFTIQMLYRKRLLGILRSIDIEHWKLQPQIFGYNNSSNREERFVGWITHAIILLLVLCPIFTSILLTTMRSPINSTLVYCINFTCILIIGINTAIIISQYDFGRNRKSKSD